ncbi:unnamed protein product [Cylindrotheca closterium]|uniref:AAA+ ATPase domain-containing protein n=1 Tax=Cylindrotheca closterium TaxID=2856 RepID=A0AAD2JKL8_9STRA|nr:unnamed protein product [Cylindrotheca closterium]
MSTTNASAAGVPWVERYRPKSLKDVSHQGEVVATLQNAVTTGRLPHLLFYGPPGSGKTSVALALCRQLWHPSQWRKRVLELNASDERGISVVRDKIKHFASLSVGQVNVPAKRNFFGGPKEDEKKTMDEDDEQEYPNPPFKIIILDEADTVTADAQAALRRIIEANSRITRFILICNYVTRVIEPLASRCAKFRFQSLPPHSMKMRLNEIAQNEGCSVTDSHLDSILELAEGDMRRAVTTLQSAHALGSIDDQAVAELAGVPPASEVEKLIQALHCNEFEPMRQAVDDICAEGYAGQLLLKVLLEKFMDADDLDEMGRARLAIRIAEAEHRMIDGADEYLQLMTVCGLAMQCIQAKKVAMEE